MDQNSQQLADHAGHNLRGPHFGRRLTAQQTAAVLRWLDQSENDPAVSVRDVAEFISAFPPLERAVLGTARSALLGGLHPSSTTHAVAMLGLRRARRLIRSHAEITPTGAPSETPV